MFLACRERLEAEQYLPFYRLRRLLAESLRLEAGARPAFAQADFAERSIAPWPTSAGPSLVSFFEHDLIAVRRTRRSICAWSSV